MIVPAQLPPEEWETQNRPGAVRECWGIDAKQCIHGVPLVMGCRYCPSSPRKPRPWWRFWA